MKRVFFIAVLLMSLCVLEVSGQSTRFGIKGGTTLAYPDISVTDNDESIDLFYEKRLLVYFGGFMERQTKQPKIKFQVELLYQMSGIHIVGTSGIQLAIRTEPTLGNFTIHQVTAPISWKYQVSEKIYASAGLHISGVLSVNDNIDDSEYFGNVKPDINLDAGILLGLEYHINDKIYIDIRHNNAVVSYLGDESRPNEVSPFYLNKFLTAGVGYRF